MKQLTVTRSDALKTVHVEILERKIIMYFLWINLVLLEDGKELVDLKSLYCLMVTFTSFRLVPLIHNNFKVKIGIISSEDRNYFLTNFKLNISFNEKHLDNLNSEFMC